MLPANRIRTTATAAVTAIALAATAASPAQALGKNERNFLKGAAVATLIGALYLNAQKSRAAETQRSYTTAPQPVYQPRYQPTGEIYSRPITYSPTTQPSVSGTPAARAFNSYTLSERRQIQARLQQWGYYNGGIDGTFGPQTYRAISAYAADARATEDLNTVGGSYDLYEQLIG